MKFIRHTHMFVSLWGNIWQQKKNSFKYSFKFFFCLYMNIRKIIDHKNSIDDMNTKWIYIMYVFGKLYHTMPRAASHSSAYVSDMNKKKSIFSHSIFLCVVNKINGNFSRAHHRYIGIYNLFFSHGPHHVGKIKSRTRDDVIFRSFSANLFHNNINRKRVHLKTYAEATARFMWLGGRLFAACDEK